MNLSMRFGGESVRVFLAGLLLVVLSACVPTSENPLPVSAEQPLSPQLLGSWIGRLEDEDGPVFLHFVETNDSKTMAVLINGATEDDPESGWAEFRATSSELTNGTYLNLYWTENDGEPVEDFPGYHLMRYLIDEDGNLTLYFIDSDILDDAIDSGALAGEIKSSGMTRSVRITASTDDLAAFVQSHDAETLFPELYGTFRLVP